MLLLSCICPPTQERHDPAFLVDASSDGHFFFYTHLRSRSLARLFPGTRDTPRSLGSDSSPRLPARSSLGDLAEDVSLTSGRLASAHTPQRCFDFLGQILLISGFCRPGDPAEEQSNPLFLAGPRLGFACQSQHRPTQGGIARSP